MMSIGGISPTSAAGVTITPELIAAAAATPPTPAANLRLNLTTGADGKMTIDLDGGYRLLVDEEAQTVVIENSETGKQTTITGNARIDRDSKRELQFWGTTSFAFGDEAKLTLKTIPANDGTGDYRISEIIVTNGDRGFTINGFSDDVAGNLKAVSGSGTRLDERNRDGLLLVENERNGIWKTEDGQRISQEVLDLTAIGGTHAPGTNQRSQMEILGRTLSKLLSLLARQQGGPSSNSTTTGNEFSWTDHSRSEADSDRARRHQHDRYIVEKILADKAAIGPRPTS